MRSRPGGARRTASDGSVRLPQAVLGGIGIGDGKRTVADFDNNGNLQLMVTGAGVLDSNGDPIGGGSSLTGWSTDEDGNLVNTGDGAIVRQAQDRARLATAGNGHAVDMVGGLRHGSER